MNSSIDIILITVAELVLTQLLLFFLQMLTWDGYFNYLGLTIRQRSVLWIII